MSFAEAHARWATGEPSFVDSAVPVPEQDAPTRVPIEAKTSNVAGTVPQWIYDSLLRSYDAERATRKDSSALFSIASLLEELLTEVRRGNSTAREGAVSSCEIKFLAPKPGQTVGVPQPVIKAYAGSAVPVAEALQAYGLAYRAAEARAMAGWVETVESLQA